MSVITTELCQWGGEAAIDTHKGMRVAVFRENFSYKNRQGMGFGSVPWFVHTWRVSKKDPTLKCYFKLKASLKSSLEA